MATAKLTITDGPDGVTVVAESDPAIPMRSNSVPDIDACTDAQCAAIFAAKTLHDQAGRGEWRTLVR